MVLQRQRRAEHGHEAVAHVLVEHPVLPITLAANQPDRVDIEPPIFKGCSSSELLAMLLAALASSWNILGGFAGQISLGHAVFFGLAPLTLIPLPMGERTDERVPFPYQDVAATLIYRI